MKKLLVSFLLCMLPCVAQSDSQWALYSSMLSDHISHRLHEADGVSHSALGKGVCHAGKCDFLIVAQVKSFDSGDSNRELHMVQVTQRAKFPIVSVRLQLPEVAFSSSTIVYDLDIQFAGQTAHYQHLTFHQVVQGMSIALREPFHPRSRTSRFLPRRSLRFLSKTKCL
jgi:hypothetical protein